MKSLHICISARIAVIAALLLMASTCSTAALGADADKIVVGNLETKVPASFARQKPRSQIIAHEFSAPAAEGDQQGGRLTVTAASGSIDANLERWYGQFTQPDGKSTKERTKTEKIKVAGHDVLMVDISGTYDDKPSPREAGVKREGYRMLAAIVSLPDTNVFFKFYGPEKTVAAQEKAFDELIKGLTGK